MLAQYFLSRRKSHDAKPLALESQSQQAFEKCVRACVRACACVIVGSKQRFKFNVAVTLSIGEQCRHIHVENEMKGSMPCGI